MYNKEEATLALAGVGALAILGTAYGFVKTMRIEKKKRAKIAAWERENLACIAQSYVRLSKLVEEPNFNWSDFAAAWEQENDFLNYICERPMY